MKPTGSPPSEPRNAMGFNLLPATTRAVAHAALAQRFRALGFDDPAREAALVLRAAGLEPTDLIAEPDAPLGAAAADAQRYGARRAAGEPLSRIVGRREFWGLTFALAPEALDPRPETETIVEAALVAFAARRGEALRIVDFGVGSGALLAALLSEFPAAHGVGVDLSPGAAAQARVNLGSLGLAARAEIRVGDWAEGVAGAFDLIVANPPYVPSGDIAGLPREVRDHDPRLALDGGADGLDAYRALTPAIARLLAPTGRFFVEVGAGQADAAKAVAAAAGLVDLATHRDLAGIERVVSGGRAGVVSATLASPPSALHIRRCHANRAKRRMSTVETVQDQPHGELTVRLVAMPSDTNANGDIFGGWVLSQMDLACGIAASERAKGRVATVAVDAMTFIRPVKVGDVLCVYTSLDRVGRTSMKLHVEAWARRFNTHERENGRPRPVPPER
jgi:release factor glutamine methyltransferase